MPSRISSYLIFHSTRLTHFKMSLATHIATVIDRVLWRNVRYAGNFYNLYWVTLWNLQLNINLFRAIYEFLSFKAIISVTTVHSRIYGWWIIDWRTCTDFIYYAHSGHINIKERMLSFFIKCFRTCSNSAAFSCSITNFGLFSVGSGLCLHEKWPSTGTALWWHYKDSPLKYGATETAHDSPHTFIIHHPETTGKGESSC